MAEAHWPDIEGWELRYGEHTWELTGDVDVRGTGEVVEAVGRRVDDVRHQSARLRFVVQPPPESLNPGDLGRHFDRLERDSDGYHLVVEKERRTYRYGLRGVEYD